MSIAEYRELLAAVTYKPGWQFTLREAAGGFARLEVQAAVADSWPPHVTRTIAITYSFHLDDWQSAARFYAFVRASALRTEQHESNEFFRVNGKSWPTEDHAAF